MLLWDEITVPQIGFIHAEDVLKAHEIFLGHLEMGEECRTKQMLLLDLCGNTVQSLSQVLLRGFNLTIRSKNQ